MQWHRRLPGAEYRDGSSLHRLCLGLHLLLGSAVKARMEKEGVRLSPIFEFETGQPWQMSGPRLDWSLGGFTQATKESFQKQSFNRILSNEMPEKRNWQQISVFFPPHEYGSADMGRTERFVELEPGFFQIPMLSDRACEN